MIYKATVMMTETIHRIKDVEIEAEDEYEAQRLLERGFSTWERRYAKDAPQPVTAELIVNGVDQGRPDEWPQGTLSFDLCFELSKDTMEEALPYNVERLDWELHFTPEQIAEQTARKAAQEADPEFRARRDAMFKKFNIPLPRK